jgi:steroid 5-alpha reductase family enzyme
MTHFTVLAIVLSIYLHLWFFISVLKKNVGLIDIAWGLSFVVITWTVFLYTETVTIASLLILSFVTLWGLRLTYYLFLRNWSKPEDYRYVNMRKKWGKIPYVHAYFKVFYLQILLAFVISLPLQSVFYVKDGREWFHYVVLGLGIALFIIGFIFESVSDAQLRRFKSNPNNKGKIMDKGLWGYTRHPNYFGDFMIWLSYFVIMFYSFDFNYIFALIGTLMMGYLLRYVSGVPLLEKRYKDNELYQAYSKNTPIFFPKLKK